MERTICEAVVYLANDQHLAKLSSYLCWRTTVGGILPNGSERREGGWGWGGGAAAAGRHLVVPGDWLQAAANNFNQMTRICVAEKWGGERNKTRHKQSKVNTEI